MAARLGKSTITSLASIDDDEVLQALPANQERRFFGIYNETGANIYISFGPTEPADTTTMVRVKGTADVDGSWQSTTPHLIVEAVQIRNESGGTLSAGIKIMEAF